MLCRMAEAAKRRYLTVGEFELVDDEPIDGLVSHPFELSVNMLVKINCELTLAAINQLETELIAEARAQDADVVDSIISQQWRFCEDLRFAANNFAIVSLVALFQRELSRLANQHRKSCSDGKKKNFEIVKEAMGEGPESWTYFEELRVVRNSIVHHEARGEWEGGADNKVADRYLSAGMVEITESDLCEAVKKVVAQVEWWTSR